MNKKGQNLTLGTIILIVLGIAVLVFLIFGFSTGWSNMWDKITNIGGGKTNVDAVRTGCELACTGQSEDSYCIQKRRVNYGEKKWDEGSCKALEAANIKITPCAITCTGNVFTPLTSGGESNPTNTKKCDELTPVGSWVANAAACPSPKKNRNSDVGDDSDKATNTVCCSD